MKKLFLTLILILNLQSWTKADDIRDFEVEGISLYDSALDFFSEADIKKNSRTYYKNKKFTPVQNDNYPFFKNYMAVDINYITGDNNYIIQSISGVIDYRNKDMNECYKEMDSISGDIKSILSSFESGEKTKFTPTDLDPTGKTTYTTISFWSDAGRIAVTCYDYSEETGHMDHLSVAIMTLEFNDFLNNEAYK